MSASWTAWARGHKTATVVLSVLAVAVSAGVATAIIGPYAGGTARGGAVASAARPVSADPAQPAMTRGAKWLTGPAGRLLDAVTADVGRINADHRAGNSSAARRDGTRLVADASAALGGPMPPVDAALYRSALRDFGQAGADTGSGNFRAASLLLAPASLNIVTVTAAEDPASPSNSPASPKGAPA